MKPIVRKISLGALAVLAALSLTQCASPLERRVKKNPQEFAKLSEADKSLVAQGKVREGMTKGAVFLSWGPPARVAEGKRNGQPMERWTYVGFDTVVHPGGYGWGRGMYCDIYDPFYHNRPVVDYVPYDAGYVEFVNGLVSAWAAPKGG